MTSEMKGAEVIDQRPQEQNILRTVRGSGMIFAGKSFSYGIRFLIGLILARFLGAEEYGLYSLTLTIIMLVASFTYLGFGTALVRYVSIFSNREDEDGVWGTLIVGIGIPAIASLIVCFGLFALANYIAEDLYSEPGIANLLRITCLMIPFLTLNAMLSAAIEGFNRMEFIVISENIVQPILRIALLILFVLLGLNALKALTAYSIVTVVATVVLIFSVNRIFSIYRNPRTAKFEFRNMIGFSLPIFLTKTVQTFGSNIQTILLGSFSTLVNVGIFTVTDQVGVIGRIFHESVVKSSKPVISNLFDKEDFVQLNNFYQTTSKWTFTLNLPFFLIILLFPTTILSIFGESYIGGASALIIIAWANLVNTGTGICGAMIDMSGNSKLKLLNSIVAVSSTLIINIVLIPIWGLIGAALAALASSIILNSLRVGEIYKLYQLQPYNWSYLKPILASSIALIVGLLFHYLLPFQDNILMILINIVTLLLAYFLLIYLLGFSKEDRMVLAFLRNKIEGVVVRRS
jgi:O-antigen/teichoic acid export membrane protein